MHEGWGLAGESISARLGSWAGLRVKGRGDGIDAVLCMRPLRFAVGRRSGRQHRGRCGVQVEMPEDSLRDRRVLNQGAELAPAPTRKRRARERHWFIRVGLCLGRARLRKGCAKTMHFFDHGLFDAQRAFDQRFVRGFPQTSCEAL